jgi:hypothetical protein
MPCQHSVTAKLATTERMNEQPSFLPSFLLALST